MKKKLLSFLALVALMCLPMTTFAQIQCTLGGQSAAGEWSWGWNQTLRANLHFSSQWGEFNLATSGVTEGATYKLTVAEANPAINLRFHTSDPDNDPNAAVNDTEITGTIPEGVTKIGLQATEANQDLNILSFTIAGEQTSYSTAWGTAFYGGSYTSTGQWAELMVNGVEGWTSQVLTVNLNTALKDDVQLKVKFADATEDYPHLTIDSKTTTLVFEKAISQLSIQATAADQSIDIASVTTVPFEDITISPASGSITEAIAAAKTEGYTTRNMTINLTEGAAYTIEESIVAGGSVAINGAEGVTIDASALTTPFIQMSETPAVEANTAGGYPIDNVTIKDVKITGLKYQLFYANKVKYLVNALMVDNSVIAIDGTNNKTIFDFNGGGLPVGLTVNNSTLYANPSNVVNGGLYSTQSGSKLGDVGADANVITITNSTLYNIANGKPVSTLRQNSQTGQQYVIKNNIIVDCGAKGQFLKGLNARQAGTAANWDVDGNVFNFGGENVTEEAVGGSADNIKNTIVGVVTFTDATADDFNAQLGIPTVPETPTVVVGDPRWTVTLAQIPSNIVINDEDITDGDLSAAITAKTTGLLVGDMTINLAAKAYTINASITAGGSVAINGAEGATIDASALTTPFIQMSETPAVEANTAGGYPIDNVTIKDVKITGLKYQLFYANKVKYLVNALMVDNSVIAIDGTNNKTIFDFNSGGLPVGLTVNNSTIYANPSNAVNGGLYSTQSGSKLGDVGADANVITITNSTLYNIANGKPVSTLRQNSQDGQQYVIKNNIIVDCGAKGQFLKGLNARQAGTAANWDVDGNVFNFGGENVTEEAVGGSADNIKNTIAGVVTFTDAAAGDFNGSIETLAATVAAGDPRWTLTVSTPIQLVTTAASGYTTLVSVYPLDFTSAGELKAYVVAAATDVDATAKTVKLTEITEAAANTPVILYGSPSTDYNITAKADAAAVENNLLKGDATKDATLADDEAYLLKDGKFGLCTAGTLPAGKAYLPATTSEARELVIVFDGDATGIDDVTRDALENGKIYNLQGQEVKKAGKGIFIINGKKVVIK